MTEATAIDRAPILIVNADDYGLTPATSSAVLRAATDGIVTSLSALALPVGAAEDARRLSAAAAVGVGAHLALVGEDPPLLPAREIPTLIDAAGALAPSWRTLARRLALGRVDPDDVRRELQAQIDLLTGCGLVLDHLDSHQHLHLWPSVRRIVIDLARTNAVPAIRVPGAGRGPSGVAVAALAARLRRAASDGGLLVPAAASGPATSGRLALQPLHDELRRLAATGASSLELGCHPGAPADRDRDRYRWGYAWGAELDALVHPSTRVLVDELGLQLGTYGDLTPAAAGEPTDAGEPS